MQAKQRPERRLYREHKYLCALMFELDRKIAKTDFCDRQQVENIEAELTSLLSMLGYHAQHEDEKIHALLKKYNSTIFEHIEADHQNHAQFFSELKEQLANILNLDSAKEKVQKGHDFYLSYRKFLAENLEHLHQEETRLMPELTKLCSKEELESIDYPVYQSMNADDLFEMLKTLFPVLNPDDKNYFISDLMDAAPDKLKEIWPKIAELLTEVELAEITKR